MKKLLSLALAGLLLCSAAACSAGNGNDKPASSAPPAQSSEPSPEQSPAEASRQSPSDETDSSAEQMNDTEKAVLELTEGYDFSGIICAYKDGEEIVSIAEGNNENGEAYKADDCVPVGSVSKQFCAASVMLLQEQGKLSLDDTLDKYFPEYEPGKKILVSHLLSMRSGIPNFIDELAYKTSENNTAEENIRILKEWIFSQPLKNEPDTEFEYCNTNYFLLSLIVEQVSGKKYTDFLRESIFALLGMKHTGSIPEMAAGAEWTKGASIKEVQLQPGLTQGAGDIVTCGEDISLWLTGLASGKVISEESFKAMATDHSSPTGYGYGLYVPFCGGIGHPGSIGIYSAADYINTDDNVIIFISSSTLGANEVLPLLTGIVEELQ